VPEQLARALPGFEDTVAELAPLLDDLDEYDDCLVQRRNRDGDAAEDRWSTTSLCVSRPPG